MYRKKIAVKIRLFFRKRNVSAYKKEKQSAIKNKSYIIVGRQHIPAEWRRL